MPTADTLALYDALLTLTKGNLQDALLNTCRALLEYEREQQHGYRRKGLKPLSDKEKE
jgi:hypothetical protein